MEADPELGDFNSSEVINGAVFERNTLFEEYCNLKFVLLPVSNGSVQSRVQGEVQTASGDFYIISQTTSSTAAMATSGYLYNYLDLDIDYDNEWWDEGTLNFALDGRVFFMDGPFNIVDDDVTFVMMFNKDLREEYRLENPYDVVKAGNWTMSYFNSVISHLSHEEGDGRWDEKDTYGFVTPSTIGDTLFYGAGLQFVRNDPNMDFPELALTGQMDKATDVLTIARSIVFDNNSTYLASDPSQLETAKDIFAQGRAFFYCEAASYLRALNANMEREYGVLPIPKYDKAQEFYTTWRHSIGSTLSMPTSVGKKDTEQLAYVLETYCLLSQKLVRPAYYEVMLTTRNVRDVESAEIIDEIFRHRTYDMAIYFESLGFAGIFASAVCSAGGNFSSLYDRSSRVFDTRMEKILRKIQNT